MVETDQPRPRSQRRQDSRAERTGPTRLHSIVQDDHHGVAGGVCAGHADRKVVPTRAKTQETQHVLETPEAASRQDPRIMQDQRFSSHCVVAQNTATSIPEVLSDPP